MLRICLLALLPALLTAACADLLSGAPGPADVVRSEDRVFITDRTGKRWDVTHAQQYGLKPDSYQYGLGPRAIRPIMDPRMLAPGDEGYPFAGDTFLVLGVDLNGATRAYPISVLSRHEIANERFGEAHVAVAY